jgi:predicted RNase H-like HicB family nuclease
MYSNKKFIVLRHIIKKEGKGYSACCPELDVCSQGKTVEEANENLKEAVTLYLDTMDELGQREKIFKRRNIVFYKKGEEVKFPFNINTSKNSPERYYSSQTIPC